MIPRPFLEATPSEVHFESLFFAQPYTSRIKTDIECTNGVRGRENAAGVVWVSIWTCVHKLYGCQRTPYSLHFLSYNELNSTAYRQHIYSAHPHAFSTVHRHVISVTLHDQQDGRHLVNAASEFGAYLNDLGNAQLRAAMWKDNR